MDVFRSAESILADAGLVGARALVAVSGGLDSVCLLHVLHALWKNCGGVLEVAHVDHGLRADSADDAQFCRALSEELGLPFHVRRLAPPDFRRGRGLQAEARRHRRAFLESVATRRALQAVALGHHADDQVETVLFRLLRGVGPRGVAGMAAWSPPFVRPFLRVRRAELLALAQGRGWAFREDPSNRNLRFSRNRIRHELLPLLRSAAPGAEESLLRYAGFAAEDDAVLTGLTRQEIVRLGQREPEGIRFPREGLAELPRAIRRRLYLAAWADLGLDASVLQTRHLLAIDALLHPGRAHRTAPVPGPGAFAASYGDLWVLRPAALHSPDVMISFSVPARRALLPLGGDLVWSLEAPAGAPSVRVPADRPMEKLTVRTWAPGDRLSLAGRSGRKVKDLLMEERIPAWRRRRALVLEDGREVLGVLAPGRAWGRTSVPGSSVWLDGAWFPVSSP